MLAVSKVVEWVVVMVASMAALTEARSVAHSVDTTDELKAAPTAVWMAALTDVWMVVL